MRNEDLMQNSNGEIRIVSLYAGFGLPLDYCLSLKVRGCIPGHPFSTGNPDARAGGSLVVETFRVGIVGYLKQLRYVLITPGKMRTAYTKISNV